MGLGIRTYSRRLEITKDFLVIWSQNILYAPLTLVYYYLFMVLRLGVYLDQFAHTPIISPLHFGERLTIYAGIKKNS